MNTKQLKTKAKLLEPIIRIGKAGITENQLKEIKKLLKKKKLIKIKFLKSFVQDKNKKEVIKEVVEKTKTVLVDAIGNVIVLYKKPKNN